MTKPWRDKYVPKSLDEMVVTPEKRRILERIITELPNALLYGHPGTGKSCFMKILESQVGKNFMLKVDAALEGRIDTIRHKVKTFAEGAPHDLRSKKVVYFAEADQLTKWEREIDELN